MIYLKALITFKYTDEEMKSLKDLGYEIIFEDEENISFSEDMKDVDMMVCFNPFDKINIGDFPNLKWIQLLSAGINQVPIEKIKEQNIILTNNKGGYSIPIAEWTVMRILEMLKNTKKFYKQEEEKMWKMDTSLLELYNKTLGFIGTGDIAQETAKRLKGFGVEILGFNFRGRDVEYFDETYKIGELEKHAPKLDFLVIAAPYTEETHHLINEDVFKAMKDGLYLVNIARGSIIDEKALIENLQNGKVKKAALDVVEIEPLPEDSPLWTMDNVIISPHNSWASEMNFRRRYEIAYKNMKKYINKEDLVNIVDIERGY